MKSLSAESSSSPTGRSSETGVLGHPQDLPHLGGRAAQLVRDLGHGRLALELLHELAFDADHFVEALDDVDRNTDRPPLVGERPRHRLADPPRRVGGELVAAAMVELLDGADQAERALLDQVEERQPAAEIALRDRDHEAQVGLDHLLLGGHVAALDALREHDLLGGAEQRYATDCPQVQPQRVEARLDGEVELGARRGRRRVGLAARLLPVHDLDALLLDVGIDLGDLLAGELGLLDRRGEGVTAERSMLGTVGEQPPQLVVLGERGRFENRRRVGRRFTVKHGLQAHGSSPVGTSPSRTA